MTPAWLSSALVPPIPVPHSNNALNYSLAPLMGSIYPATAEVSAPPMLCFVAQQQFFLGTIGFLNRLKRMGKMCKPDLNLSKLNHLVPNSDDNLKKMLF